MFPCVYKLFCNYKTVKNKFEIEFDELFSDKCIEYNHEQLSMSDKTNKIHIQSKDKSQKNPYSLLIFKRFLYIS